MAGEWRTATVQQLVDEGILDRPMDGNHGEIHPKARDFVHHGIPFITASDLDGGRVDMDRCAFISEVQARTLRKGFARSGDVLISHKATMGRTALVEELNVPFLMLTPQVTYYRVCNPSLLDHRYLKFYFDSPAFQALFETWGQKGSTRAYIGITAQLDLPIVLPPIDEQRAIAHILGTMDDKIELNRRTNETLAAMARTLFKSWFVDYDPVRAKTKGRHPALPKGLGDLFPDSFEDSEMGEIPKGWRVGALDEICSVVMGLSPGGASYNTKAIGTPLINGPVEFGDYFPAKTKWTTSPTRMTEAGDLVLCVRGSTTGRRVIADDSYCLGRGVCGLRAKGEARMFLYQAVNSALDRLLSKTTGSVFPNLSAPDIKGFPMLIPPKRVMQAFEGIMEPLTERLGANVKASGTLAALRDTLLPKLISGELRIPVAEKMVDGAI